MEFKRLSIDTSKHVFTIHGVDDQERPVLRREIRRAQVEPFFAKLASTEVVWFSKLAPARTIGGGCSEAWATG
jgi:transposase